MILPLIQLLHKESYHHATGFFNPDATDSGEILPKVCLDAVYSEYKENEPKGFKGYLIWLALKLRLQAVLRRCRTSRADALSAVGGNTIAPQFKQRHS